MACGLMSQQFLPAQQGVFHQYMQYLRDGILLFTCDERRNPAQRDGGIEDTVCIVGVVRKLWWFISDILDFRGCPSWLLVYRAGISYKDRLLLYDMTSLAMRRARICSMLVIQAATLGIPFDDLVAHCEVYLGSGHLVCRCMNDGVGKAEVVYNSLPVGLPCFCLYACSTRRIV
jgi:hypothetical protein